MNILIFAYLAISVSCNIPKSTKFGLSVLYEIIRNDPSQSAMISPVNLYLSLAFAALTKSITLPKRFGGLFVNVADGEVRGAYSSLGVLNDSQLLDEIESLLEILESGMTDYSSLFSAVNPSQLPARLIRSLRELYKTRLVVDWSPQELNSQVRLETSGMIFELLERMKYEMVFLQQMSIEDNWDTTSADQDNHYASITVLHNPDIKTLPATRFYGDIHLYDTSDYVAARLPLRSGKLSFIFMMGITQQGLDSTLANLLSENGVFEDFINGLYESQVSTNCGFAFPRLHFEKKYRSDLLGILKQKFQFDGIFDDNKVFFSFQSVVHAVAIAFDKNGVQAAASTGIFKSLDDSFSGLSDENSLLVDMQFMFMLMHDQTREVFFAGYIKN